MFYKWWKPRFLISKKVFGWFLLNYTDFAHKILHIKPSKYDSTFGNKISKCLKKSWGMRLWIGTSTFKLNHTGCSFTVQIEDTIHIIQVAYWLNNKDRQTGKVCFKTISICHCNRMLFFKSAHTQFPKSELQGDFQNKFLSWLYSFLLLWLLWWNPTHFTNPTKVLIRFKLLIK